MRSSDLYDRIYEMLDRGLTTKQVLDAFPSLPEKMHAASILSTVPDPKEALRHDLGTRALIGFCIVLALLSAAGVLDAYVAGKNWTPPVLSMVGHLSLVYGFVRRRLWAYAGFPLWVLCMLLSDLRSLAVAEPEAETMSGGILVFLYAVAGVFMLVAYEIRRRVYPYAGLTGPRRKSSGQLAILADLEREGPGAV